MLVDIVSNIELNFGPASYASLLQTLIGFVAIRLRVFNIDKAGYRKSITEITEKSVEEMSILLSEILERKVETSIPLRGAPPHHQDIVAKFQKLIFTKAKVFIELERDFFLFKMLNRFLFYLTVLGIALLLLVTVFIVDRDLFLITIFICIILEVLAITIMFAKVEKLDNYI